MEFEIQRRRDVRIWTLLEGQIDVQADGFAARLMRAQVSRFHDSGPAAGSDHKPVAPRGNVGGPLSEQVGEAPRVLVVARHVDGSLRALHVDGLLGGRETGSVAAHAV